ncbi:formylglycine-generating enzyme family protein [Nonomuraea sp. NPDC050790]|uniref:formylglycine-generating enzyme family protein n=1 Tax=Nonomuraea sp. NPDC050790 TaxID=3364371 RepID=UPI003788121F
MVPIAAGEIVLRDEGTRKTWTVRVPAFELAAHPVTREEYGSAGREPVTDVSWREALVFCNRRSAEDGLAPCYALGDDPDALDVTCDPAAGGYRLPTEAEWEYACRAGSTGERYGDLDAIAWHRGNADGAAHAVATRRPNAWGLHDTIGNVWEWCWDLFDPAVYGPYRVFRGGGWQDPPRGCRASARRKSHPSLRIDDLGFRLARTP